MSVQIKFLAASILLTGMIGLAGCSSNNEQANSASPTTAPTETVTATAEPEVSPSTTPLETAPAATASPMETNKDTANANPQNSDKQLQELLALAKRGRCPVLNMLLIPD